MSGGQKAGGGTRGSGRGNGVARPIKARTPSSRRWLERQLRDPYVADARRLGYRSRAAFKLLELDDRFRFLRRGALVVDLGAAPGGWAQVAAARVGAGGRVIAVDRLTMPPIDGVRVVACDVLDESAAAALLDEVRGRVDVVLSDMAPAASGHAGTDHLRIIALAEAAFAFARDALTAGGSFVCKVWHGGAEPALLRAIKASFATVRHAKPPASRAESAEIYLVATGFRGR